MSYFTTNDNTRIYYDVAGQGKNLLMVHGYGCSSKYFKNNVPELSKHFRVITVDLRGHGNSSKTVSGARVSRLATDIHELLQSLDLHDVTYLGWSMGCSIGWSYWDLFRDDFLSKFIFVDETALAINNANNYSGLLDYQETLDFCQSLYADKDRALTDFISGILINKNLDISDLIAESLRANTNFIAPLFYNHLIIDWEDVIKTITLPSLVISGGKSFFDSNTVKKVSDDIPNSQFASFDDVGHLLFFEEPEKFNNLVTNFIEKN